MLRTETNQNVEAAFAGVPDATNLATIQKNIQITYISAALRYLNKMDKDLTGTVSEHHEHQGKSHVKSRAVVAESIVTGSRHSGHTLKRSVQAAQKCACPHGKGAPFGRSKHTTQRLSSALPAEFVGGGAPPAGRFRCAGRMMATGSAAGSAEACRAPAPAAGALPAPCLVFMGCSSS